MNKAEVLFVFCFLNASRVSARGNVSHKPPCLRKSAQSAPGYAMRDASFILPLPQRPLIPNWHASSAGHVEICTLAPGGSSCQPDIHPG